MLGIDVSKDSLVCTYLDPHSREARWGGSVPNTEAGCAKLAQRVPTDCPWVLEPTGRYSSLVVRFAQDQGRTVLLASPKHAKSFLTAIQSRAKTDRLDSRGLALYALCQPLRPFPRWNAAVDQLQQLLRARRGLTKALTSLQLQCQELPYAAASLQRAMASLQAEREHVDQQLLKLTADEEAFPMVAELDRVPGIGRLTAAAIAACLQSKNFDHPDQFVAYVGLDVKVRQSGKRTGQVGLTREGDAELRRLLYLAALSNTRCKQSPFKALYAEHRAKGMAGTAAACAVARKLARVCWSLVKHRTRYDPARVRQQGKRQSSSSSS